LNPRPVRRHAVAALAKHQRQEIGDRAFLHAKRAVHVGFAEPNFGIEDHAALRGSGDESDGDRPAAAIAE